MKLSTDEITCPICLVILSDPWVDVCGHTFCKRCIDGWLAKSPLCPLSNKKIKEKPLYRNLTLKKLLEESVPCAFAAAGCNWTGKPIDYDSHAVTCDYKKRNKERSTTVEPKRDAPVVGQTINQILNFFDVTRFFKNNLPSETSALTPPATPQKSEARLSLGVKLKLKISQTKSTVTAKSAEEEELQAKAIAERNKVHQQKDVDSKFTGEYKVEYADGSFFDGFLIAGKRNGRGVLSLKNGEKYEGGWKNDVFEGDGEFTGADDSTYVGQFVNGKRHGKGREKNEEWTYEGEWKSNEATGQCWAEYKNGERFEGEVKKGQPDGTGKLRYPNGDVYVGSFKKGLRHGIGKLTLKNGDTYEGKFEKNELSGRGTWTSKSGAAYKGEFANGKRNGEGMLTLPNTDRYVGRFRDDLFDGQGLFTSKDGTVYEGKWVLGKRDGEGRVTYPNGEWYEGMWKQDEKTSGIMRRNDDRKWRVVFSGDKMIRSTPYTG